MVNISADERLIAESIISMLFDMGLEDCFSEKTYGDFYDFQDECCANDFDVASGATRVVVGHDDLEDWVIKFDRKVSNPYTEREAWLYRKAENAGMNEYLCPVIFLGTYQGHDFYLARKCDCNEYEVAETVSAKLATNEEEQEQIYDDILNDSDCVVSYVFNGNYDLEDWLDDNCVNDVHSANIGILNGMFVIIDYAGYGDRALNHYLEEVA